ncbi:hypothetical protein ACEN9D_26305 [Pseudomonas sp. CT11-2]|uniref:hypothetical protein n=1 Tax=unclassified Pseudomonas TaxID=196821 RepID=UPI00215F5384|nr:hypothetical protein [Pseudomonas sp. B21-019]UVM35468.1 hypothetical protein LOY36_12465 [Pseudomonas sp. B21-019]
MPSEDGDLVSKLSARLSEEIQNLPKDGNEHQLTIDIKGNRGHINLGRQTFDINTTKHPPPQDSDRSRQCPQCDRGTWRYTRLCIHCDYNLQSHDDNVAQKTAQARQQNNNRNTLKICVARIGIADLSFTLKDHLPEALKAYALIATGAFGCVAFMLVASH